MIKCLSAFLLYWIASNASLARSVQAPILSALQKTAFCRLIIKGYSVFLGTQRGGGGFCVTLCLQHGGTRKFFFQNFGSFCRFGKSGARRQKLPNFTKNFFVSPTPFQTHGYTNAAPHRCVPGKTHF